MYRSLSRLVLTFLIVPAFMLFGCAPDDTKTDPEPDYAGAQLRADSANAILADILYVFVNDARNDSINNINQLNVNRAYETYLRALAIDNNNATANFGAAITTFAMICQDPETQTAFNDWKDNFKPDSMFFTTRPQMRIDRNQLPVNLPFELMRKIGSVQANEPQFSSMQNIMMTEIVPRVDLAIGYLTKVTVKSDFQFIVTGRMQGDPLEDPVELDLTEVYSLLTELHALKAVMLQTCSYNFDLDNYGGTGMLSAITRGSSFLALKSNGASRMATARQEWVAAMGSLNAGIYSLEHETDPQANDFIRIDPHDGVSQADLDSIKHYIPKVTNALNSHEVFTFDEDNRVITLDISLERFFNNPIADMKELVPPYTVVLDSQGVDFRHNWEERAVTSQVNVPTAGQYRWNVNEDFEYGELNYASYDTSLAAPGFDSVMAQSRQLAWRYGDMSHSIHWNGYLPAGASTINAFYYYSYDDPRSWRFVPRVTWTAQTFAQWIFPNPSFNGLFRNITTDAEFKSIFHITDIGWQRTEVLRIW